MPNATSTAPQAPDSGPIHHCPNHNVATADACAHCHRQFCEACLAFTLDGRLCAPCHSTARRRRTRRHLAIAGAGVLAAGGIIAFLALSHHPDTTSASATKAAAPAAPDEPIAIRLARATLAEAPCERSAIVALAAALADENRYADVVSADREWIARCGPYSYLDWKTFNAHKQLRQWSEALTVVDRILATKPRDSDFSWWRGEIEEELGQHATALADYRQSIANSDSADGARYPVGRMMKTAPAADQPCQLVAALRYFREDLGGPLGKEHEDAIVAITREAQCRAMISGTKTSIPQPSPTGPAEVKAHIASAEGRFLVEAQTGTTIVTKAFAARAGISATTETAQALAAGRLRTGHLARARIDLGGIAVDNLPLLVVDDLGADLDGVIALDFLWNFRAEPHGARILLRPRP